MFDFGRIMNLKFLIFVLFLVIASGRVYCEDQIASIKAYSELNITEIVLKNGMHVILKPTNFENDEVIYKLTASGGYGTMPADDVCSGQLAAQIGWESGMGDLTSDQISVLLYEHSLEFFPKIYSFYRTIDGLSTRDGVDAFLKCLNMFFTKQQFNREGFKTVIAQVKDSTYKSCLDCESFYESQYLAVNTREMRALQVFKQADVEKVNFDVSKRFFHECFTNPADFTLVIVGSFDLEKVKSAISERLGSIPASIQPKEFAQPNEFSFPQGITKSTISISSRKDSLTRITLPLTVPLNEKNIASFECACQIIEARLRRVITEQMKLSYGVDVAYEFPLFPSMLNPWISIQFRCDQKKIDVLTHTILTELANLQKVGPTLDEVNQVKKFQAASEEFWLHDNTFWVSTLSNFYLWKWDPLLLIKHTEETKLVTLENMTEILKTYFDLSHYSIVSAKPKNVYNILGLTNSPILKSDLRP